MTLGTNSRTDPTRTSGLRARFQGEMIRRFATLKKDIKISIVDNNCFGIRPLQPTNQPIPFEAFAFERDAEKLADFLKWLEGEEAAGILSRVSRPWGRLGSQTSWLDSYIDSAYQQGIRRARAELRRAGLPPDIYGTDPLASGSISAAFNMAIHAETVAMLYMRTFEDLKTVTSVMNSELRRTIAEGLRTGISRGLAEGKSIEQVTRELMSDIAAGIDKIGVTRARLIARTEIIRAHHLANVNEYRQIDSDMRVTVVAEFKTAGDDRVCETCSSFDGKIYSLDEAEDLIPVHPNCVVAETAIIAPDILKGFSGFYSGSIYKLRFANGARLSVTPNHMLATSYGFVMAKFLSEGDAVFCGPDFKGQVLGYPDDDRNPARIDNIIHALSETLGVMSASMPVSAVDFHGDGSRCQGNIDIVFPDGLLRDNFNTQFREILNGFKLEARGIFDVLFADGSFMKFINASLLTSELSMGGSREILAFLRGCLRHAQIHGFASITRDDAGFFETTINDDSFASKILRQLLNGGPRVVKFQELSDIYFQSAPGISPNFDIDSGRDNSSLEGIALFKAIDFGQMGQVFSRYVSTVCLLGVEIEHVTNLRVYDVSTSPTVYFANGILSSNCRCVILPAVQETVANTRGRLVVNRQIMGRVV